MRVLMGFPQAASDYSHTTSDGLSISAPELFIIKNNRANISAHQFGFECGMSILTPSVPGAFPRLLSFIKYSVVLMDTKG